MLKRRTFVQGVVQLPLLVLLPGCDDTTKKTNVVLKPVPLQAGDECALCGMTIQRFPGPKGEAIAQGSPALKFCSTREMLSWWLQPENRHQPLSLFVHDMAHGEWTQPDDRHFIDARTAWYVMGSALKGSMGSTLASFAQLEDARQFAARHGGEVLSFTDITLERLGVLL